MKLNEWLKSVGYDANENMIPPPMSAGTAASILADELLGGEGCAFSVPGEQALAMAVASVVETYRPRPGLLTRIRALLRRAGDIAAFMGDDLPTSDLLHGFARELEDAANQKEETK